MKKEPVKTVLFFLMLVAAVVALFHLPARTTRVTIFEKTENDLKEAAREQSIQRVLAEAEYESAKAAKSTQETAQIYARVVADMERERRQDAEAERRLAELQAITDRYHAQQAAFAAEQQRLAEIAERARIERETERMARRYAVQRSNPASAENLRAQGVNPRFYESEQPRRRSSGGVGHVTETIPGHFQYSTGSGASGQIIETLPGSYLVIPH